MSQSQLSIVAWITFLVSVNLMKMKILSKWKDRKSSEHVMYTFIRNKVIVFAINIKPLLFNEVVIAMNSSLYA